MPADTLTAPVIETAPSNDTVIHLVCCAHPEHAFCGTTAPGDFTTDDASCVVCIDLAEGGCPFGFACGPHRPGGH